MSQVKCLKEVSLMRFHPFTTLVSEQVTCIVVMSEYLYEYISILTLEEIIRLKKNISNKLGKLIVKLLVIFCKTKIMHISCKFLGKF